MPNELYDGFIKLYKHLSCDFIPNTHIAHIKFLAHAEVCGCGKKLKKRTRAVWECAGIKAIVRRVCGCAKIGCA